MEQLQNHNEHGKEDKPHKEALDTTETKLEVLEERITGLSRAGFEHTDISEEREKKITRAVGKLKSVVGIGALAFSLTELHEVAESLTPQYTITEETDAEGRKHFMHEDAKTDQIMKYLTGETDLPEEDRLIFYRQLVRGQRELFFLSQEDRASIESQNKLNEELGDTPEELRTQLADIYEEIDVVLGRKTDDYERKAESAFKDAARPPMEYSPEFATTLWRIQQKVGAPRIRWTDSDDGVVGKRIGHGRAYYVKEDNTVYLTPGEIGQTLVAEDAHAYQYTQSPVWTRIRHQVDTVRTKWQAYREAKTFYEVQQKQYETPGTVEHEAHTIIEPMLIEEARRIEKTNE